MEKTNLKDKIKQLYIWISEEIQIIILTIILIINKKKVWSYNYLSFLKEVVLSKKQILSLFKLLVRFTIYGASILFVMDLISKYITAPILTGIFNFIFKILIFLGQLLYKAIYWIYIAATILFNLITYLINLFEIIFHPIFEGLEFLITSSLIYFFKLLFLIYSFLEKSILFFVFWLKSRIQK
uniref:Uncharacterized protein n=1 Tax=Cyanophora paradoxa TaxID=2762 RepID=A0A097PBJ5_CYAPA|nr:hypothetical protein [Cyanophora paradoxa]